jgi:alpha-tubulin suppressor-like RCC1 family protein
MKWWLVVVVLAGCQQLFGLKHVPGPDAAPDAPPPGQWTSVVVGSRHACGLDHAGHVACWGDAIAGGGALTPTSVGQETWTEISATSRHTCGVSDGHALCWGVNQYRQVTGASGPDSPQPTMVPLPATAPAVEHVSAGAFHSCALAGGQLFCWGNSQQIGGAASEAPLPLGQGMTFTAVSAGYDHSCAIDSSGGVSCWGADSRGQVTGNPCASAPCPVNQPTPIELPAPAIAVSAGNQATCAVLGTGGQGQIWCWGSSATLQVGGGVVAPIQVTSGDDWTGVAVGNHGVCGVRAGQAWCWGKVSAGGLGDGVWSEQLAPTATLHGIAADSVAMSASTDLDESACVVADGNISCWGENRGGQLAAPGTLHLAPTVISAPQAGWQHVWMSDDHTCAQTSGGALYCWGADDAGQVSGTACTAEPCDKPSPTIAPAMAVADVVTGDGFTCARAGTTVTCWGDNQQGELGTTGDVHMNTLTVPAGSVLAGGGDGACALGNGANVCWGHGSSTPAQEQNNVPALVAVGFGHAAACGITTGSQRGCWGYPYWGQLGDGVNDGNALPRSWELGTEPDTYGKLATNYGHSCAVTTAGNVSCWGTDYNGESGRANDGGFTLTPQYVTRDDGTVLGGCSAIATGGGVSCAICSGAPTCWGATYNGQSGLGIETSRDAGALAVKVPGGKTWTEVASGGQHSCELAGDGTLACWGEDLRGEIGDGSHASNVPVLIPGPP